MLNLPVGVILVLWFVNLARKKTRYFLQSLEYLNSSLSNSGDINIITQESEEIFNFSNDFINKIFYTSSMASYSKS